jgi:hypothetical protein
MRVSDEYLHFMMKRLRESSSSLIAEKETHERLTQAEDACSLVAMIEFDDACLLAPSSVCYCENIDESSRQIFQSAETSPSPSTDTHFVSTKIFQPTQS